MGGGGFGEGGSGDAMYVVIIGLLCHVYQDAATIVVQHPIQTDHSMHEPYQTIHDYNWHCRCENKLSV